MPPALAEGCAFLPAPRRPPRNSPLTPSPPAAASPAGRHPLPAETRVKSSAGRPRRQTAGLFAWAGGGEPSQGLAGTAGVSAA